jgi:hypothetical protein
MRFARTTRVALLSALCGLAGVSLAADGGAEGLAAIRWRGGGLIGNGHVAASADLVAGATGRHVVMQFNDLPGSAERAKLEGQGITFLRYLGNNAYFVRVRDGRAAARAAALAGLHGAADIRREWKQHPKLLRNEVPPYARIPADQSGRKQADPKQAGKAGDDTLALYVLFHADVDVSTAGATLVERYGGAVRSLMPSVNGAVVWLPASGLDAFAAEDEVQWVEPPLPPLGTYNDGSRAMVQVDQVRGTPYNLDGTGIRVLVYDGGTAMDTHPDFGQRLTIRDNSGTSDHPTHVAGTIGGSGYVSGGLYAGMAPGITMESFGFDYDGSGQFLYTNPGDMEADYRKAVNTYGVVLANNSIGTNLAMNGYPCDWEGDYGATDVMIDSIVRGSLGSPMRIVWAAGNERGSGRCGLEYHTTAPPACAKNHITVGAVNSNDETMASFSSWGPTDDGRLKPDVCAPGCQTNGDMGITSTIVNGQYGSLCGTSMAAPAVTGLCALILQDWKQYYPEQPLPPNSLLKVLLTHNAVDLGPTGPDYRSGYGSVRIRNTIDFLRSGHFIQTDIDQGELVRFYVPVLQAGSPVRVTIAWDDPPGAVNTVPELVNDIDLELVSPSGVTWYPWTLDPANPSAPAVRTRADHVNNIEQVFVDGAEAGTWTINLRGTAIPLGPQAVSLAASPELRTCSSTALVELDSPSVSCASSVGIRLTDCDIDTDPGLVQTATVMVSSSSDPAGKAVTLTETSSFSGIFEGKALTSATGSANTIQVTEGDSFLVTYIDADDGAGHLNQTVTDSAVVDCQAPVVSGVQAQNITASTADIALVASEPVRVDVRYGAACGQLTTTVSRRQFSTAPVIRLTNLVKNTQYYYVVDAYDHAGNRTTVDGGSCLSFRSMDRQDYFTQMFGSQPFDLANKCITFTPQATIHKYRSCMETISALPADSQGSTLYLSDDSYAQVSLTGNKTIPFYGIDYSSFFVGSNGFITFGTGDTDYTEAIADHFHVPRISVLFNDFNPPSGTVRYRQMSDRVVVTWDRVPQYGTANLSTFQVSMGFDGVIKIAWTTVASGDGLVGLSEGKGEPLDFEADDLSTTVACLGLPEIAFDPRPDLDQAGVVVNSPLVWGAGSRATSHELYFGSSPDVLTLVGTLTATTYTPPVLKSNQSYYWRVDEVNSYGRTPGVLWAFTTRPLKADFDQDGDVDLTDYAHMQLCFSGTNVAQADPACQDACLDGDTDVDSDDAALFAGCISGANRFAVGTCLP